LLVAGAATAGVAHHYGKKAGEDQAYEDQAYDQAQATPYAPAPPEDAGPSAGDIEEIKKLAELHDSGALTDEEFSSAKAKLLA